MNRKLLVATIFSAAIFIVFLGMRNPCLNQNHGPSQRPRAVLETCSPDAQESCQNQSVDAELPGPYMLATCTIRVSAHSEAPPLLPSLTIPRLAARAPPCELSLNA